MATKIPFERSIDAGFLAALRELGAEAARHGVELWIVGGAVRDTLLNAAVLDVDLAAERHAHEVAAFFEERGLATTEARSQFGTVKLRIGDRTLDLATARREEYSKPGALPRVWPGSMEDDLARRDVTINAMAASLAPARLGELLDPLGGVQDLDRKVVRILHRHSFRDDATRVFRVIRYAVRLDFRVERQTAAALRRDMHYLDTISPARLHRELQRTLIEPKAVAMLAALLRTGAVQAMHANFDVAFLAKAVRRARREAPRPAAPVLLGLLGASVRSHPADVARRLGLTRRQASIFSAAWELRRIEPQLASAPPKPSAVAALTGQRPLASIQACAISSSSARARRRLKAFLASESRGKPPVSGRDLARMGLPQGPAVGQLLGELAERWRDGAIRSEASAQRYARRRVRDLALSRGSSVPTRGDR